MSWAPEIQRSSCSNWKVFPFQIFQHPLLKSFCMGWLFWKMVLIFPSPLTCTSFNYVPPELQRADNPAICRHLWFLAGAKSWPFSEDPASLKSPMWKLFISHSLGAAEGGPWASLLQAEAHCLDRCHSCTTSLFFLNSGLCARSLRFIKKSGRWWSQHIQWGHPIKVPG